MKKFSSKKVVLAALLLGTMSLGLTGMSNASAAIPVKELAQASQMQRSSIHELDNDTRVFKVDKTIEAKNVRFENRYGFEVAGHLYLPKNFDMKKQYKALVVSGPFGAVKEQSSGLYAQEM